MVRSVFHWVLALWFLVSTFLPSSSAFELCACSGELSFTSCACETASNALPTACCESDSAPAGNSDGPQLADHSSCEGCIAITTGPQVPRVDAPFATMVAMPVDRGVELRRAPIALPWSAADDRGRTLDPPWSRRNLELRL